MKRKMKRKQKSESTKAKFKTPQVNINCKFPKPLITLYLKNTSKYRPAIFDIQPWFPFKICKPSKTYALFNLTELEENNNNNNKFDVLLRKVTSLIHDHVYDFLSTVDKESNIYFLLRGPIDRACTIINQDTLMMKHILASFLTSTSQ